MPGGESRRPRDVPRWDANHADRGGLRPIAGRRELNIDGARRGRSEKTIPRLSGLSIGTVLSNANEMYGR